MSENITCFEYNCRKIPSLIIDQNSPHIKIFCPEHKNKTLKTRKFDSQIKYKNLINKMNDKSEQNSNSLIKLLIILAIIAISIYFLVTKYLCVGFIKVNDNQIIEFNNQSNKIEIV